MKSEPLVSIVMAMLGIAMVAVIVQSQFTTDVFGSAGTQFINSVKTVMGNGTAAMGLQPAPNGSVATGISHS